MQGLPDNHFIVIPQLRETQNGVHSSMFNTHIFITQCYSCLIQEFINTTFIGFQPLSEQSTQKIETSNLIEIIL